MNNKQAILAITGSDGTGGSGVQADIRCISELGGIDVVATIAEMMQKYHPRYIIYAPVQTSTHGDQLVEPQVFSAIKEQIIPLCTIVLEPSDLPSVIRKHGQANQLSAALAYYLSCGESINEAMLHARSYLSQFPKGYTEDSSRSGELYNLFLNAVDRFHHLYSDVAFYAEQLGVSARYLGQVTRHVVSSPLQRRCFLCRAVGCQRPLSGTGNAACRQPFTQVYHRRAHHRGYFRNARHQQAAKGDCTPVGILFTGSSLALLQEADGQGSQRSQEEIVCTN